MFIGEILERVQCENIRILDIWSIEQHCNYESSLQRVNKYFETILHNFPRNKLLPPKQRSQTIASMLSRCSDLDSVYHAIFYNTEIIGRLRANQVTIR